MGAVRRLRARGQPISLWVWPCGPTRRVLLARSANPANCGKPLNGPRCFLPEDFLSLVAAQPPILLPAPLSARPQWRGRFDAVR